MKHLFCLLAVLAVILSSCSSKNGDDILATVPAKSEFFVLADLKAISSDLGKDGKSQLDLTIDKIARKGGNIDARWKYFFSNDSQVDFSAPFVIFEHAGNTLATFYTKDADKFRAGIENAIGAKLEDSAGIFADAEGTVFMKDSQVWFADSYPQIESSDIAVMAQLPEKDCILSIESAKKIAKKGGDIISYVNIDKKLAGSWNRQSRILLNAVFDDASFIVSTHNFEKGKAVGTTQFLNYKGEPSSLAFKMSKIDVGKLKKFVGKGNCFFAMGINPDMTHAIVRQLKNLFVIPADIRQLVENLDGNIAAALTFEGRESIPSSFSAMLTFDNKNAAVQATDELRGLIPPGESTDIFTDDDRLYLSSGTLSGAGIDAVADDFKGACLGVSLLPSFFNEATGGNMGDYLDGCTLTLHDDGNGAEIRTVFTTKSDRNALVTLLQFVNDL